MEKPTTPPYTWSGKGLRLIDLLDQEERRAVLSMFPSERSFRAEHIKGDAAGFVAQAQIHNVIDDLDEKIEIQVYEKTLEGMGWQVVTAMDGRLDVVKLGSVPPLRGSIAPGARTESQVAYEYLRGLAAQAQHPAFPVKQRAQRMLFVSKDFAEFLNATGEPTIATGKDPDGDVARIWPARHDQHVERAMRAFHLATLGANIDVSNEKDSPLAKVAATKTPKQYAVWKAGLSDQWRMMESLREVLLGAAAAMTAGAYADQRAGGELTTALRSFQQAFQYMAEDAESGVLTMRAADELSQVCTHVVATAAHLKVAPVNEQVLHQTLLDSFDLSATIEKDLEGKFQKYTRDQNRESSKSIDASNGLG